MCLTFKEQSCCWNDICYYSTSIEQKQILVSSNSVTADCGSPSVFLNGTMSYRSTTEGSEAHYRCDDGFTLEGEMTAVCRADGRWNSTPVCRQLTGILGNHTHTVALKKRFNSVNCSFQFSQYDYCTACILAKKLTWALCQNLWFW